VIAYVARRVVGALVLTLLVSSMSFVLFWVLPSTDPATLRAGRQATPQLVAEIRAGLGLNKPIYVQYARYMRRLVFHFDLGYSYQDNYSVRSQIFSRLPATASLAIGAIVLWLILAAVLGTLMALRPGSLLDRLLTVVSLFFISSPVYWLGLVGLLLFSQDIGLWHLFPGAGTYAPFSSNPAVWASSLVLPWIVLASTYVAIYARVIRTSLLEVLGHDYIRTARAKGLGEFRVVARHAYRSAMTPIVTLTALDLGGLLGGVILVETIFNIPGIGRLAWESIQVGDLPMIQGTVLVGAFFIIALNLGADLLYGVLDTRVRPRRAAT